MRDLGTLGGPDAAAFYGVNYEARGGRKIRKGQDPDVRGATSPLFRRQHHLVLTDAQAKAVKKYLDSCLGHFYDFGMVPTANRGGDCSGLCSGAVCVALGKPVRRLFTTATWKSKLTGLGFKKGLGKQADPGVADRTFPGHIIKQGSRESGHVLWIKARLNFAANNKHPELGGKPLTSGNPTFGSKTTKVVRGFQARKHLGVDGKVGKNTWRR